MGKEPFETADPARGTCPTCGMHSHVFRYRSAQDAAPKLVTQCCRAEVKPAPDKPK